MGQMLEQGSGSLVGHIAIWLEESDTVQRRRFGDICERLWIKLGRRQSSWILEGQSMQLLLILNRRSPQDIYGRRLG
jgi:hypothetical protein